jgi:hypothetical protein
MLTFSDVDVFDPIDTKCNEGKVEEQLVTFSHLPDYGMFSLSLLVNAMQYTT